MISRLRKIKWQCKVSIIIAMSLLKRFYLFKLEPGSLLYCYIPCYILLISLLYPFFTRVLQGFFFPSSLFLDFFCSEQ